MKVVETVVSITLPSEYIKDASRLHPETFEISIETNTSFEFLAVVEDALETAIKEFKVALSTA